MLTADFIVEEMKTIKSEINSFIDSEFSIVGELEKNNIRFILKRIVFLKYLLRQSEGDYRYKALISDLMHLISSIKKGETRYYYFNMRSIIEQALRIINNFNSTNTMAHINVMQCTEKLVEAKNLRINLDVIKDRYNTSCLYVHGSENADMELAEFYESVIEYNKQIKNLPQKLTVLTKLLKELFDLILVFQNHTVDVAFHRRKTILSFLVGRKSYSKFDQFKLE